MHVKRTMEKKGLLIAMCFGCYTQHVINILGFKYYVKLEAVMQVSDCGAPPSLV